MHSIRFVLYSRDSDCSAGTSLESYSGLLSSTSENVQQDNFLSEFSRNGASSSLHLNDQLNLEARQQQSYPSNYSSLLNNGYLQPTEPMNTQENILDFLLDNKKYEVPQYGYDPLHYSWLSGSSGTCGPTMFEEHLYPQASVCSLEYQFMSDIEMYHSDIEPFYCGLVTNIFVFLGFTGGPLFI